MAYSPYYDTYFRKKKKNGSLEVVNAPAVDAPLADTHAHVHLLHDMGLAVARSAVKGVDFICNVFDVCEDDPDILDQATRWNRTINLALFTIVKG